MSVKENLTKSLELLRTVGWIKRSYRAYDHDKVVGYCSIGAIGNVVGHNGSDQSEWPESAALARAIGELGYADRCEIADLDRYENDAAVIKFNDAPGTGFADVERVFTKAIELAGKGEK